MPLLATDFRRCRVSRDERPTLPKTTRMQPVSAIPNTLESGPQAEPRCRGASPWPCQLCDPMPPANPIAGCHARIAKQGEHVGPKRHMELSPSMDTPAVRWVHGSNSQRTAFEHCDSMLALLLTKWSAVMRACHPPHRRVNRPAAIPTAPPTAGPPPASPAKPAVHATAARSARLRTPSRSRAAAESIPPRRAPPSSPDDAR